MHTEAEAVYGRSLTHLYLRMNENHVYSVGLVNGYKIVLEYSAP